MTITTTVSIGFKVGDPADEELHRKFRETMSDDWHQNSCTEWIGYKKVEMLSTRGAAE